LVSLAILVGIAWGVWFAVGSTVNIRKGNDALKWMQQGLPLVGERTTFRWLGTSVAELKIVKAKAPFREAEVLVVLEPRDVPILWWLAQRRGRRDLMIFRSRLRQPPRFELEVMNPRSWTGREAKDRLELNAWSQADSPEWKEAGLLVVYNGSEALRWVGPWLEQLRAASPYVSRLSVRRSASYHIQIHLALPHTGRVTAHNIFRLFQHISQQAMPQD